MMLLLFSFLVGLGSWGTLRAQSAFVRQADLTTGIDYDVNVSEAGSLQSPKPLSANGAQFQLWYYNGSSFSELAETLTTVVNLSATLSTSSCDVVNPHRTRVDKFYTLNYSISGLLVGQGDPGDQYVDLSREATGNLSPDAASLWTTVNGPLPLTNGTSSMAELASIDYGEENWAITRPATGYSTSYRYLNTVPAMEIFPLATASLTGVPSSYSGPVSGFPNSIGLTCTSLYPSNRLVFLLLPPSGPAISLYDRTINGLDKVNCSENFDLRPGLTQSGLYSLQIWQKVPVDSSTNPAPPISDPVSPGASWGWEEITTPTLFTTNFSMAVNANIMTP